VVVFSPKSVIVIYLHAASYWGRDANSSAGISWFIETSSGEWVQLGEGDWFDYPGDWTLKVHIYNENSATGIEVGNENRNTELTNYPNPFTTNTSITFYNPENQNVKLYVTDINGKVIQVLLNNKLTKGKYSIDFNSEKLSSAIYIYTIQTKYGRTTKKMIKK